MTTPISNASDLQTLGANSDVRPLGYMVMWSVRGILVPLGNLADHLTDFDLKIGIKRSSKQKAVRQALEEMKEDGLVRRLPGNKAGRIVYVVVRERVDLDTEEPEYWRDCKVVLARDEQGNWQVSYFDGPGVALGTTQAVVEPLIDKYMNSYTANDIASHVFHKAVRQANGLALRETGGVYFTPDVQHDLMERLANFARYLAGEYKAICKVDLYPIHDVAMARAQIAPSVTPSLLVQINELVHDFKKMQEATPGTVRTRTVGNHMAKAMELAEKARFYKDLLHVDLKKVDEALKALVDGLKGIQQASAPTANFSDDDDLGLSQPAVPEVVTEDSSQDNGFSLDDEDESVLPVLDDEQTDDQPDEDWSDDQPSNQFSMDD